MATDEGGVGDVGLHEPERVHDGPAVTVYRTTPVRQPISFATDLDVTSATQSDWPYFARWHYLGHTLSIFTGGYLLWHHDTPIACCMFTSPALENAARHDYFDVNTFPASTLNKWFQCVQRIVLDPRYRGAGLAADFLQTACFEHGQREHLRYIELITSFGSVNHFCQAAGFDLMGVSSQLAAGAQRGGGARIDLDTADRSRDLRKLHHFILDLEHAEDPRDDRDYSPSEVSPT